LKNKLLEGEKMKLFRLLMPMAAILLCMSAAMAQEDLRRIDDSADRLAQQATQLADNSYSDFRNRGRNTRAEIDALFQDQQLGTSADFYRRLARDRRSRAELRDAIAIVSDIARRSDRFNRQRSLMTDIQRTISDIQRDLNFGGGGGPGFPSSGSLRWRGTVDDVTHLYIRDSGVEARAVSGQPYSDGTYNFTSALPNRRTTVRLNKIRGRGDMRIIQQPARNNDFTAIIEIRDTTRGPSDYELEVSW
jgi:hypothetical protein